MKYGRIILVTGLLVVTGLMMAGQTAAAEEPVTPTGQAPAEAPKVKPPEVTQPVTPTKRARIIIVPLSPEDILSSFGMDLQPTIRIIENTPFGIMYLERRSAEKEQMRQQVQEAGPEDRTQPTISVQPKETMATEIEKTITTALKLFKEKKFDKAADTLKQYLLKKDENAVVLVIYGHTLFAQGYYKLAARSLRKGIGLIKDFENTPMDLKEFYDSPETLQKQTDDLATWVKYTPTDLEAQFLLGYVYFFTNQPDKSIPIFQNLKEKKYPDKNIDVFLQRAKESLEKKESPQTPEGEPANSAPKEPLGTEHLGTKPK